MKYLLAISIGPVQEFISAARRTRDLWFGSQLLSEISRATARAIPHGLIFPSSVHAKNVANVILAEIDDLDPAKIAENAKRAAAAEWKRVAEDVRSRITSRFPGVIRSQTWANQVDDVIETYSAWVPRTDEYSADRRRVNRMLGGRKNARDFRVAIGEAGIPKSSLDGQRESVLERSIPPEVRHELRLSDGEQLDVVGLVKRLGFGKRTYPSVARLAADSWVQGVKDEDGFAELVAECERLVSRGLHRIQDSLFSDFAFEGTAVFVDRHHDLSTELGVSKADLLPLSRSIARLSGKPNPYLAVLVADGDGMGKALDQLKGADEHREFSSKLAGFAGGVEEIVSLHRGVLVYSGGDDVLAFLPVNESLACASSLSQKFSTLTGLTLSVGIGIGHFMENLEDLLQYGRDAEKAAKSVDGKNALAVHVHKRGGAPIEVQASWKDGLHDRLAKIASLMNDRQLSGRVAYDLRRLADLYNDWPEETVAVAIQRDVERILSAKKPDGGASGTDTIRELIKKRVTNSKTLEEFAKELLVARLLAEVLRQAKGKDGAK